MQKETLTAVQLFCNAKITLSFLQLKWLPVPDEKYWIEQGGSWGTTVVVKHVEGLQRIGRMQGCPKCCYI